MKINFSLATPNYIAKTFLFDFLKIAFQNK